MKRTAENWIPAKMRPDRKDDDDVKATEERNEKRVSRFPYRARRIARSAPLQLFNIYIMTCAKP